MDIRFNYEQKSGYTKILFPDGELLNYIEFGIIKLSQGEQYSENTEDNEVVLVILRGKCVISTNFVKWGPIGERKDVFSGKAYAIYIPRQNRYDITAATDLEVAVCKGKTDFTGEPFVITPDKVKVRSVGNGVWTRDVYDIIDERTPAGCLLVGETINPPGNWSSFPPHKHDIENSPEETKLEEIYFFKIQPEEGFGMQRVYTDPASKDECFDEALVLKNNTVTVMPRGYHPVCAAPGYSIYYLWVLAGKNRKLIPNEDPQHSWIGKEDNLGDRNGQ